MRVCFSVEDNCWNFRDSYGEICVQCGCCSKDKNVRYRARIKCLENWIEEEEHFGRWSTNKELRALQEENVKINLEHYRRQLRYYKKRLSEVE